MSQPIIGSDTFCKAVLSVVVTNLLDGRAISILKHLSVTVTNLLPTWWFPSILKHLLGVVVTNLVGRHFP